MVEDKITKALNRAVEEKDKEIDENLEGINTLINDLELMGVDMSKYKSLIKSK